MAKHLVAFIAVLACCLTSPFSSAAAPPPPSKPDSASEGRYSLTPSFGGIYYSATGPNLFAPLYGLTLGYDNDGKSILDSFGTELTLNMYDGTAKNGAGKVSGYLLRIEEVLPFTLKKKLVPFAAVGIGGILSISDETRRVLPFFSIGPGIKYYFNDNLMLRADARQILTVAINGIENFEISAGLTYRFDASRKERPAPKTEAAESGKEQKPDEKAAREQKEKEQKEREQREKERLERERAEREQRAQEWKKWEEQKKAQLRKEMEEYEQEQKRPAAAKDTGVAPTLALSPPELTVAPPLPGSGEKEAASALPLAAGSTVASEIAPSAAVPTPAAPAFPKETPAPTPAEAQAAPSVTPAEAVPAKVETAPAVAGALPATKEAAPSAQLPAPEIKAAPVLPAAEAVMPTTTAAAAAGKRAETAAGSAAEGEPAKPAATPLPIPAPAQPTPEKATPSAAGEVAAKAAPRVAEPSAPEAETPRVAPAPAPAQAQAAPSGKPAEAVPAMALPALPAVAGALPAAKEAAPTAQLPAAEIKAAPALPAAEAVTPTTTVAGKQAEAAAGGIAEAETAKPAAAPLPVPAPAQPAIERMTPPAAGEAAAKPAARVAEPSAPEAAAPGVAPAPAPAEAQAAVPEKAAEAVTVQVAPAPLAPPAATVTRKAEPATPAQPAEVEAPPAAPAAPVAAVPAAPPVATAGAEPAAASGVAPKPAELPAERQLPPSSPAAGAAEEGGYYTLAAGETISRKKHETLLKRLTAAGERPVVRKEVQEKDVYRLVSECTDDREAAKKLRDRLAHKVEDAFIARDGDSFCVVAGSFLSEEDAQKGQKQLARKSLTLKVVKSRVSIPVWSMTSGEYGDMREAEAAAGRLAGKGVATAVRKVDSRLAKPAAKRVVRELTIEFDFDKQNIKPEYLGQLKEMADFLKTSARVSALIEGHTDGIGGDAYNYRLSSRRARSVKQALVKLGVPSGRISVEGFGKTRPVADNATAEGRKKNRRAVTIILVSD